MKIDHEINPARGRSRTSRRRGLVVRFAGDSGDGVQLAGLQFARATQQGGSELVTLPEFPAEIRAPAGTVYGVSAYQVHFGAEEIWTPGDDCDVLVAFNPAAFVTNIGYLTPGGVVIIDEDAFDERAFRKAGIDSDPIDENAYYSVIRVPISKRTLESVAEFELGRKDSLRAKNFWTLGFTLWFCSQSPGATLAWVAQRFAADPEVGGANAAALKAGYAFGETMEVVLPEVEEPIDAASKPGASRLASGTQTMALGIAASGALLERPIFYCSYPITPASALLHELAKLKTGVRTFQAEDEIAAACAAIGASYAGGIGVSASSGPGLSLKTEAIGLAVAAEIPLIVIDVQRAGPSTGMPTKPEQSDLDMAVFGRHGEAPVPVLAPATPADCFNVMIDAARIAAESMTPVIVLSDAFLANAVTEWTPPSMESLEAIATDPHSAGSDVKSDEVFSRDEKTLARPWVVPGTAGLTHRTGGLEKDAATGNISYDPANHQDMVRLRADKIARVTTTTMGPFSLDGPEDGELLVVGWGSTYGPIRRAVSRLNDAGHKVGHLHIRQLWPLPAGIDDILSHYKSVVCAELNSGQLAAMLRSAYLVPVEPITKTTGRPFGVSDLKSRFQAHLGDEAK